MKGVECSVYLEAPQDFHPGVIAAACYCEYGDKILLLKKSPGKTLGNTWCVPGGKIENEESPRAAVIREVYEEVGLKINEKDLEEVKKVYVRWVFADVVLYRFRKRFLTLPPLNLNLKEHCEAQWVTIDEALQLPHITGGVKALEFS